MPDPARLLLLWLVTACLAVGLPLQSVSAAVAGVLGPRHAHLTAEPHSRAPDPMAGWKDFRRADHNHGAPSARPAQAHSHDAAARHHHDPLDESIIGLDALSDGDAAPAEIAQASASFVFVAAAGLALLPQPAQAIDGAWRMSSAQPFSSQYPRRIERPPQASAQAL